MPIKNDVLGSITKSARKSCGLTIDALAEKIGISARYLSSIENENKKPSFEVLYKLIRILTISPDSIFYPETPSNDSEIENLVRLLHSCDDHSLKVVRATVEALLENQLQTNS